LGDGWQNHPAIKFILSFPCLAVSGCQACLDKGVEWLMKGQKMRVLVGLMMFGQWAVAHAQSTQEQRFQLGSVEVNLGVGLLNGQSREKAYRVNDGGKKISQLNWDIKQLPTLHLGLTFHPLRWLSLEASGWTKMAKGDSHMKDYDWLKDDRSDWSHYSDHPDTRIQKAWQAEVAATVWALKRDDLALGVMLGYQHNEFGWQARGGRYNYSSRSGYRDVSGDFPAGLKGITYQQTYDTPYVGLVGLYSLGAWTLESRFKYSQWVKAQSFDEHHLRDLTFAGNSGNKGRMQSLAANVSYRINPQWTVKAGIDHQVYAEAKGSVVMKNLETGNRDTFSGKSGGQSNKTTLSTLAVAYQF
jgi:outer membrane protease